MAAGRTTRSIVGAAVLAVLLSLGGCSRDGESLEHFEQRWHHAVNQREARDLFHLLDSASQRRVQQELELLRGLDEKAQQAVIDQLGGKRVKTLLELPVSEYFALLWQRATDGRQPTMKIEASDDQAAYMVLGLEGRGRQRVRLIMQGGRWSWQLPAMAADQVSGWWSEPGLARSNATPAQTAIANTQ